MGYEPTGKPPGRPRKDGLPAGTKPEEPKEEPATPQPPYRDALDIRPLESVATAGPCRECFPAGAQNAAACVHGSWIHTR